MTIERITVKIISMKNVYDFDKNMAADNSAAPNITYYDAKNQDKFSLYGSFALSEGGYCRFTKAQRDFIEPISDGVAWLSTHSSGIQVKFRTNATDIYVRVKLSGKFDMTNMTQIGQCGTDLYVYDENVKCFVFHGVAHGKFDCDFYDERIGDFSKLEVKERRFVINLPLYIGTLQLEIGVNDWATVTPDYFSNKQKIVVYGTSITQGCSASHPGMAYTNILSRKLDAQVINYGFSGVAMNEKEIATIITQNPCDILILDTEPNAGVSYKLKDNLRGFLDEFYGKKPNAAVVMLSRVKFALDYYDPERVSLKAFYVKFMKNIEKAYSRNNRKIYFYDQANVFGNEFSEYTTDGVHPTDLGMVKIADFYEKAVKRVNELNKVKK